MSSSSGDPQSGPSLLAVTGFYHCALEHIRAEPGRLAGLHKSNYIHRVSNNRTHGAAGLTPEHGGDRELAIFRAATYVERADGRAAKSNELGANVLITCGLPVRTGAGLARVLDAAERKADGSYRCYGGRLPRVGVHGIMSFSRGLSPAQAGEILQAYAEAVSARLKVPLEGQVHNDDAGEPDHAHLIIGTREVVNGKIGRKARGLDAVSEKADRNATEIDGRWVGHTIEWIRAEWARRMREASGDETIDHRSYKRRGLDVRPVTYVSRTEIEYQRRLGLTTWRDQRAQELASRISSRGQHQQTGGHSPEAPAGSTAVSRPPPEISVEGEAGHERRGPDRENGSTRDPALKPKAGNMRESAPKHGGDAYGDVQAVASDRVEGDDRDGGHRASPVRDRAQDGRGDADGSRRLLPQKSEVLHRLSALEENLTPPTPESTEATTDPIASIPDDLGVALPIRRLTTDVAPRRRVVGHEKAIGDDDHEREANAFGQPSSPPLERSHLGPSIAFQSPSVSAGMASAIHLMRELTKNKRLSRRKVAQLAETAGTTVADLDDQWQHAIAAGDDTAAMDMPAHEFLPRFQELRDRWLVEDNALRRAKRATDNRAPSNKPWVATPSVDNPTSDSAEDVHEPADATKVECGEVTSSVRPMTLTPRMSRQSSINNTGDEDVILPRPETLPAGSQLPMQPHPAATLQGLTTYKLDRVIVEAHTDHVRARAVVRGVNLDAATIDQSIAFRLRATGRSRIEVAAALAAAWSDQSEPARDRIRAAVDDAFSAEKTATIEHRPKWAARMEQLTYRAVRQHVFAELKQDLGSVWRERSLRAEEARQRHADRVAWLHHLRWGARRLRRHGLVLGILSVLVELAVLRPMLARARTDGRAEQQAIYEAARLATVSLKARRAEWLAFRTGRAVDASEPCALGEAGTSTVASRSEGDPLPTHEEPNAVLRVRWFADEDEHLFGQIVLACMVTGSWNLARADRLARVTGRSCDDLHAAATKVGTSLYGDAPLSSLTVDQLTDIRTAAHVVGRRLKLIRTRKEGTGWEWAF